MCYVYAEASYNHYHTANPSDCIHSLVEGAQMGALMHRGREYLAQGHTGNWWQRLGTYLLPTQACRLSL